MSAIYDQGADELVRYSEFDDLRRQLITAFPHAKHAMPDLPPKSVLCTPPARNAYVRVHCIC